MDGLSYQDYLDAVERFVASGKSVDASMRILLQNKFPGIVLPQKMSNLTQKARKYASDGKDLGVIFLQHSPTQDAMPLKSPLELKYGLSADQLINMSVDLTCKQPMDDLTCGLVYEMETFRRNHNLGRSWSYEILRFLFGMHASSNEAAAKSFERVYEKVQKLKHARQDESLKVYISKLYDIPSKHQSETEKLVTLMCHPPLDVLKQKSSLALASFYGAVTGNFIKHTVRKQKSLSEVVSNLTKTKNRLETTIKEKDSEIQKEITINEGVVEDMRRRMAYVVKDFNQTREELHSVKVAFKPKNVKRREETLRNKIKQLKSTVVEEKESHDMSKQGKIQMTALKDRMLEDFNKLEDEKEQISAKYEKEKQRKINAQKKLSKIRIKTVNEPKNDDLVQEIKYWQNEHLCLQEKLQELKEGKEIETFKNGKYTNTIRELYMELLSMNVSVANCERVVRCFLQKFKISSAQNLEELRLPKRSLASNLMVEAGILSSCQVAETLLNSQDNTLHLDGTKKKFVEYASFQVTTGEGQQLTMGVSEMEKGDSESFLNALRNILKDFAELMLPASTSTLEKSKEVATMLQSFKNTMSDRHIVNKKFNSLLELYRHELLPLIQEGLDCLTDEQISDFQRMNNLYCGLHVLPNMASVARETLKEFESLAIEKLVVSGFQKDTSRSFDLLYELSKSLSRAHSYQKLGMVPYWESFLKEKGQTNHIPSFKGERLNIAFVAGGAAYFHRNQILEFLEKFPGQQNKLSTAIKDVQQPLFQACHRSLGILNKLLTGPLFRLLETTQSHIFALNAMWEHLVEKLNDLSANSAPLMEGMPVAPQLEVTRDEIYEELFKDSGNADIECLTKECLQVLCASLHVLLKRQLADQLPGGKYYAPDCNVMAETKKAPLHNIISERDFSHVDRLVIEKPNVSAIAVSSVVKFCKNKTANWLQNLDSQKKHNFMDKARKSVKIMRRKSKDNRENIVAMRQKTMLEKQQKKELMKRKKSELVENLSTDILSFGGLWTVENIDEKLSKIDPEKKREAVIMQLKFHKAVLANKSKLLNVSVQGKTLQTDELLMNLKVFLQEKSTSKQTGNDIENLGANATSTLKTQDARLNLLKRAIDEKRQKSSLAQPRAAKKSRRNPVGHTILHRWQLEDGTEEWFEGHVLKACSSPANPACEFEVQYVGSLDKFNVPLYEDMEAPTRDVVVID